MLWNDDHLFVGAELEESHVWGVLTERDSVIYHDNDFELFLDPDGDTHEYFELEINALGTEWDLRLTRPYRDDGEAIDAWDIAGLRSAVHVDGTPNRTDDSDRGWSVEIAIPWAALEPHAGRRVPPGVREVWRANFSRVEWQVEIAEEGYAKRVDPATGEPLPEDNWVWSPQGLIDMHYPEMWGFVRFSGRIAGAAEEPFVVPAEEGTKWALRRLYYAERRALAERGRYTDEPAELEPIERPDDVDWPPTIQLTEKGYVASLRAPDGRTWHISQDGRTW
jgi:hypothetical protein